MEWNHLAHRVLHLFLHFIVFFRRRKRIEEVREEIERKRKQWNKRKPGADNRKNSRTRCDE